MEATVSRWALACDVQMSFDQCACVKVKHGIWHRHARLYERGKSSAVQQAIVRHKLCLSLPYPSENVAYFLTSIWSVFRELRIRQAYVQHLESLTMQKDVEKEALQKRVLEQVAGAYKQAQDDAINRLTETSASLQVNRMRCKCPCTDACISRPEVQSHGLNCRNSHAGQRCHLRHSPRKCSFAG